MKRRLFCYVFVALCAATVLPSCSDDENTADYTQVIEEEIAGEYKGVLDVKMDGVLLGENVPQNITIAKASASAITLSLKNFSFAGMPLGDIELKDCALVQDGENYVFTQAQPFEVEAVQLSCTIKANGTLEKNGKLTLKLDMGDAVLAGTPQNVQVVYTGTRLKGTEQTEAKIISFTFDTANEKNACVIEQPVIGEDNTITFRVDEAKVEANPDLLKGLEPTVEVSKGATYTTTLGNKGFSTEVAYSVLSEDGKTTAEYKVKTSYQSSVLTYSFEEWEENEGMVNVGGFQFEKFTYHLPEPRAELATSAEGASMLGLMGIKGMPVYKSEDDKKAGKSAIKLVTMDTSANTNALVPALTAGSVFTGKFNIDYATEDKMKCTEFGIPYNRKPLTFKGWYKYIPGEKFINGEGATSPEDVIVEEGKVDECSIMAVLYEEELVEAKGETEGENGGKVMVNVPLDGHTINNSPRRVAVAMLADGSAKENWTQFELPFTFLDGKTYDSSKNYYLAIVCSSSKQGDRFIGAGGSTLMLDELEVKFE